jgi:hypothetical protein
MSAVPVLAREACFGPAAFNGFAGPATGSVAPGFGGGRLPLLGGWAADGRPGRRA